MPKRGTAFCFVCGVRPADAQIHLHTRHPAASRAYLRRVARDAGHPKEGDGRFPRTCVECGRSYTEQKEKAYKEHVQKCAIWGLVMLDGEPVYCINSEGKFHFQIQDIRTGHRRGFMDIVNRPIEFESVRPLTDEERAEAERIYLGGSPFELEEIRRVVDSGQGLYPGDALRARILAQEAAPLAALEGQAGEWEQVRTQNADLREFIRSQDARIAALEVVVTMARTVLDESRWVAIPMGVTIINNAIDTTPQLGDLADLEDALLALGATHGD